MLIVSDKPHQPGRNRMCLRTVLSHGCNLQCPTPTILSNDPRSPNVPARSCPAIATDCAVSYAI